MGAIIRLATVEDAEAVRGIYAPYVQDTPVSFEYVPPTVEEMRGRIGDVLQRYPWLVCEDNSRVIGYVYASPHRARTAYQWSVEVAVYVHNDCHRCGVGRALYTSLFRLLALQGLYNAYAGATLPNPGSVGLHEAVGFKPVGVYHAAGYKAGAWHDVIWWELALQPRPDSEPAPPLPLDAVPKDAAWEAALNAGLPLLRL
jgi:L-amino acid N-acyltransferase YncA